MLFSRGNPSPSPQDICLEEQFLGQGCIIILYQVVQKSYKKASIDTITEIFDTISTKKQKQKKVNLTQYKKKRDYIAYSYDGFWCVRITEEINNLDIKVRTYDF